MFIMFTVRKLTRKTVGVRYFFKERKFPWSPYLKDKVYQHPRPVEDNDGVTKYPDIVDLSPEQTELRQKEKFYDKVKNLNTVEEKLIALNLAKYYGWPAFHLKEAVIPYNYLPLAQYITRSVISEDNRLPLVVGSEQIEPLINQLKSELEKVLIFERHSLRHKLEIEKTFIEEEKQEYLSPLDIDTIKTKHLVKQLNSAIVRVLVSHYPHLFSLQLDYDPRVEAFWRVGGFYLTEEDRDLRKAKNVHEDCMELPIDRFFQYFGSPLLQLRSKLPLSPLPKLKSELSVEKIIPTESVEEFSANSVITNSAEQENSEVIEKASRFYPFQSFKYRPDVYLQTPRERIHGAIIPGFWPNDPYRFGLLSYHSSNHIINRPEYWGKNEHQEALHAQALIASYAFSYGQACYQGFSTYNDVTYPFISQSILTDGQRFSFYLYQLNTIVLHSNNNEDTNPLVNECFATPIQELYHSVENDKVTGWNEEVLLNLLALYTNIPAAREQIDLCPYLNKNEKLASQIENKKKRIFIHKEYRYITSHRRKNVNVAHEEEIYDWEKIFKIQHQVRVTDARKRHFEKFEDWINDRKLNEHKPRYIPKKFREPGRSKGDKHEDIFYPDAYPEYHEIV